MSTEGIQKCQLCGHPEATDEHAGISHPPFSKAHPFKPILPGGNNSTRQKPVRTNVTVRERPIWDRIHECTLELDTYCFAERLMPAGKRHMHIKCILQRYFDVAPCDICGVPTPLPNELCDDCKGI